MKLMIPVQIRWKRGKNKIRHGYEDVKKFSHIGKLRNLARAYKELYHPPNFQLVFALELWGMFGILFESKFLIQSLSLKLRKYVWYVRFRKSKLKNNQILESRRKKNIFFFFKKQCSNYIPNKFLNLKMCISQLLRKINFFEFNTILIPNTPLISFAV